MFLVAIVFVYALQYRLAAAHEDNFEEKLDQVASLITNEIQVAAGVEDGYSRIFTLPRTIGGINYSVEIIGSDELVIHYMNREKVTFLDEDVIGGVGVGTNLIEKIDGLIYLTPLVQFIDDAPPSIAAVSAINATAV
ncbi:MAG: hypothetical protein ABIE94_06820, partial [archaeon]